LLRHGSHSQKRVAPARRSLAPKLRDYALTIAMFVALGALALHFDNRASHQIAGSVRVVDGDTLVIGSQRIRLAGMDAPELGQQCLRNGVSYDCGQSARMALISAIGTGDVTCEARRKDRYGRFVATCFSEDVDLNRLMVENGWAVASGAYDLAERRAREAGRGIWAGEFERPGDWRAQRGMVFEDGGVFEAILGRLRLFF
jgi:endonuclease YncB( thermonuclease family)